MKQNMPYKILTVLLVLGVSLTIHSCSPNQKDSEVTNLYGNTACNLQNGGGIAQKNRDLFIVVPAGSGSKLNKIVSYNQDSGKASNIKTFIALPQGLSAYGNHLYYRKGFAMSDDSGLYRLNIKTKLEQKILPSFSGSYMIYNDYIYYTTDSQEENKQSGLYRCDMRGKTVTQLISEEISEFIVLDKGIYYIAENKVKYYSISDNKNEDIFEENGRGFYDLCFCKENLYFISRDSNDILGDRIYSYNLSDQKTTCLLKDTPASLRYVDDDFLIFENSDGLYRFNIASSSQTPFLNEQTIHAIYVFDTNIYAYMANKNGDTELWQLDLNGSSPQKIIG